MKPKFESQLENVTEHSNGCDEQEGTPLPLSSEDLLIYLRKFGHSNGSIRCNQTVSELSDKLINPYQMN